MVKVVERVQNSEQLLIKKIAAETGRLIQEGARIINVSQAIYNVLALSIESKDDVVISPLPAYGLYQHQTSILGGTFVAVPTSKENNFIPTVEQLRKTFDEYTVEDQHTKEKVLKIKSVILCNSNNPTGSSLTAQQAKELCAFFEEMIQKYPKPGFSLILDEVYFGILNTAQYSSVFHHITSELLSKSTFLVSSASKGLGAMPGARAGFCLCPDEVLVSMMIKIQMACSGNASILSQKGLEASLHYLMENPDALEGVAAYYRERTSSVVERLNQIGEKYLHTKIATLPQATFYVFADFSSLKGVETDIELQEYLRDMYKTSKEGVGVAVVPGCAFGMNPKDKLIRISCAQELTDLKAALDVIEHAVSLLSQ